MSVKLRRWLLTGLVIAAILLVAVPWTLNYQSAWDPDEYLNVGLGEPFEVEQARNYLVSVASPAPMTSNLHEHTLRDHLALIAAPGDEQLTPQTIELNQHAEANAWWFGLYADRELVFGFREADGSVSSEPNPPLNFNEGASIDDLRFEIARLEGFNSSRARRTMRWAVVPLALALGLAVATRRKK